MDERRQYMKTIRFLFLLLFCIQPGYAQQSDKFDLNTQEYADSNYILIISSFSSDISWSTSLAKKIENQVYANFPSLRTVISYLSIDKISDEPSLIASFRSAFQVGTSSDSTIERDDYKRLSSPFKKEYQKPLLMIFIGDEILQNFRTLEDSIGDWGSIPVIACCTSDSISSEAFVPGKNLNYKSLISLKDAAFFTSSKGKKDKLNLTAVIEPSNIRKSLEMIQVFYPDLKEISYIDAYYPRSAYVERKIRQELKQLAPDIKFKAVYLTPYNTDSLLMSSKNSTTNKVFITNSLNFSGSYSILGDNNLDSIFIYKFKAPLFSLTERKSALRNIGSFNYSLDECAIRTSDIISRVLGGEAPSKIPFDTVRKGNIQLNDLAVRTFELTKKAKTLDNVIYINVQPTFFKQYETELLVTLGFLILILVASFHIIRNRYYAKEKERLYHRYIKMYDDLKDIYTNASMSLYIFDKEGLCQMKIAKDDSVGAILSDNFFQSKYIPSSLKDNVLKYEDINTEIIVDPSGLISRYSFSNKIFLQILVSHIKDEHGQPNGFIVILVDQSKLFKEREET